MQYVFLTCAEFSWQDIETIRSILIYIYTELVLEHKTTLLAVDYQIVGHTLSSYYSYINFSLNIRIMNEVCVIVLICVNLHSTGMLDRHEMNILLKFFKFTPY